MFISLLVKFKFCKSLNHAYNKLLKRDSQRVAFLVCGDFCGESGVLKLSVCGIHPLTQRYANIQISPFLSAYVLGFGCK
ncbi:DUF3265 domain-containing protein [Vibrio parahaemolyticus]|uniref:hypothetical protein n=1 Tax=Vibrio parahaemolyticus TaxID=670 RepID=UPI001D648806|nr:DUF3265 domain-containing protein [Vibrio parahaemolyticus]EGQ8301933.1 DUF3265 domain-containing protein [Vibrio parahaemolyticus]EGR3037657.1 DUF3265 domain-containing protein [Vibrio parahaemolyticus]EGR3149977.1 hypothetical protein [Vibrio parahaemolyticus]EGR3164447.1 hypothetical protein [Vibrio parahaemolyticus]EIE1188537.1 DUF3265 domain-containing protein [Vibrio parahaemolyticus]